MSKYNKLTARVDALHTALAGFGTRLLALEGKPIGVTFTAPADPHMPSGRNGQCVCGCPLNPDGTCTSSEAQRKAEQLAVGDRVEVTGPDCRGNTGWIGGTWTVVYIDPGADYPYACNDGCPGDAWFPASSLQRIAPEPVFTERVMGGASLYDRFTLGGVEYGVFSLDYPADGQDTLTAMRLPPSPMLDEFASGEYEAMLADMDAHPIPPAAPEQPCAACGGSGIFYNADTTGRICPACNGTGVRRG